MIRVLAISHSGVVPGFRRKWEELASRSGVRLTLLIPTGWPEGGKRVVHEVPAVSPPYRLVSSRAVLEGVHALHFYPALPYHLVRGRPDILHIEEEPWNVTTLHAAVVGKLLGARVVFFTWENLRRRYPFPLPLLAKAVLRLADRAIAGNRDGLEILRERGFRKPIDVLPQHGIDPPVAWQPTRRRDGVFTVGFAGRLVPQKGLDTLLDAVAGLPSEVRLLIVGDGPYRDAVHERARRPDLRGRVELVGAVAHEAMPARLRRMDVLVLPSLTTARWKEQFGRVLVEAMAHGVPVIGSSSGEIPSIIGDAGLVFPEGESSVLRERIGRLIDDPTLSETLAARGRACAVSRFSNRSIAERTHAIYLELLSL